jgi:hypothetical protein
MPGRKSLLVLCLISFVPALHLHADCSPTVSVQVPATACKSGTATAGVIAVPGATYAWTVDGGQISGDAAGDHIAIVLGTTAKATASVTLTSGDCVSRGSGVIALHDPFVVRVVTIPAGRAGEPLTIIWTYENGTPGQQTISGDFGTVALAPDVRNYTYTPQNSGSKQFVIDAAMKLPAFTAPPPSRQRAVSKSPVSASPCTLAHAAAAYAVGECLTPSVVIDAPTSAVSDAKFELSVRHQAGAVATWTITNGFPATATGDNVTITAGSSGQVGVSVRLARGACADSLDRSIAITPKPACDNPKATVSAGSLSCGSALLNASLTGTPPFKGIWSDNVPFETSSTSLVRIITIPGNYSILRFQDAICEGTASGVAVVPGLYPSATIIGKGGNSCTGVDTATVFFTGKPPYSGCWLDGTCFQTNQATITKPITTAGFNTLASGFDGTGCSLAIFGGVQAFASPHVGLSRRCQWGPEFGNKADLFVFYNGVFYGPSVVTWTDGISGGFSRYGLGPLQTTTYTVAGISEFGACKTIWDTPRSITIYPTPEPEFAPDSGDLCFGSIGTTTLATPPPPGTKVEWTVQAGTLFSGQGTNSIQYQAGVYDFYGYPTTGLNVISTFTFADPNRCPLTTQRRRRVVPLEPYGELSVSTVDEHHAGKTFFFSFSVGWDITDWSLTNSMNDTITLTGPCAPNSGYCYASYTSTHGPGKSTITLHVKNACKTKDFSTEVTILP